MCTLSDDAVADILKRGRLYEVGGAVRDSLLHGEFTSKDRDYLVTGIEYDELTRLLARHGRVDLVGRSFGVIKFTQLKNDTSHTFDIALPRREYSTGWGHKEFEVNFDPDLTVEDDLARRDFTINAMARDLETGEIVDPFNGRTDIEHRLIRTTYDKSFVDDPLRMLRAVQFASRLNLLVEPSTFQAIRDNAESIKTVSAERIGEELNKLLERSLEPSVGMRLLHTTGLLKHIMPELEACVNIEQPGGFHAYDVFEHTMRTLDACPRRLRVRMAALFHDIRKPQTKQLTDTGASFYGHEHQGAVAVKRVLGRLRYGNDFIREVSTLVDRHMFTTQVTDKGMRRLMRRVGVDLIFDLLDLRRADVVGQGKGGSTDDVDEFEKRIRDEIDREPPLWSLHLMSAVMIS